MNGEEIFSQQTQTREEETHTAEGNLDYGEFRRRQDACAQSCAQSKEESREKEDRSQSGPEKEAGQTPQLGTAHVAILGTD